MGTRTKNLQRAAKGKKHLIFDFDETLFYIHPDWEGFKQDINQCVKSYDANLFETIIQQGGKGWELRTQTIKKHGKAIRQKIAELSLKWEQTILRPSQKHQELIDWIIQHQHAYTMHIRSSNHTTTINGYLQGYGLRDCFDIIVGMDTVELIKQYPDGFYYIHHLHGAEKKEYLMIGDSKERDGQAAKNAGIDFFHIDASTVNRENLDGGK